MDADYLKKSVGGVLQKAIVKTVIASPADPIEHLAGLLRAEADNIDKQAAIDASLKEEADAIAALEKDEAAAAAKAADGGNKAASADDKAAAAATAASAGPATFDAAKLERMRKGRGFIAALDQSGGSTPTALAAFGIEEGSWKDDADMFDMVHAMRSRIVTCPAFSGERVIAAILFEMTMDREFEGMPAPAYMWEKKQVVPLLKCDKGLAAEENGCQQMKPIPDLEATLARAAKLGVFGTKMRSRVAENNAEGIRAVVAQQFEFAKRIIACGLCPIIEPEVDIKCADKAGAEKVLLECVTEELSKLSPDQLVMLKLTIPTEDGLYAPLTTHANVVRVVALSGGYARDEANERLKRNPGVIASFSRALMEGITHGMSDEEFETELNKSIQSIFDASV